MRRFLVLLEYWWRVLQKCQVDFQLKILQHCKDRTICTFLINDHKAWRTDTIYIAMSFLCIFLTHHEKTSSLTSIFCCGPYRPFWIDCVSVTCHHDRAWIILIITRFHCPPPIQLPPVGGLGKQAQPNRIKSSSVHPGSTEEFFGSSASPRTPYSLPLGFGVNCHFNVFIWFYQMLIDYRDSTSNFSKCFLSPFL